MGVASRIIGHYVTVTRLLETLFLFGENQRSQVMQASSQICLSPKCLFESIARGLYPNSADERIFAVMAYDYSYAFTSYLDESFDSEKTGLFAVGGLIAQGVALFELERKWDALCKKYDVAYFRASDCKFGLGPFAKFVKHEGKPTLEEMKSLNQIMLEFVQLIVNEQTVGHGIIVDQDAFYELIKDSKARSILRDEPYRLAFDLAMVQCAWMMKALQLDLKETSPFGTRIKRPHVSFVCDEHEIYSPSANAAYRDLKAKNPEAEQYMASFSSADDKKTAVLQAADALAYIVRKSSKADLGFSKAPLSPEFNLLEKTHKLGLIQHANKASLEKIVSIHKPGESFDLSDLMENVFEADIKFPFGHAASLSQNAGSSPSS
jgi:Protein of unknown function (DUF3800)